MERPTDRYKVGSEITPKSQYEHQERTYLSSAATRQTTEAFPPSKRGCPEHEDE